MRAWFLLILFSVGYSEPIWIEGVAMEMPWRLCVEKESEEATHLVEKHFANIHSIFSLFNKNSELARINSAPENKRLKLSFDLFKLLTFAKEVYVATEGRFDPTCGQIKQTWMKALDAQKTVEQKGIAQLKMQSGFDKLELKEGALIKKGPILIDLDGCAKGYAVDQIVEALAKLGHTNIFFEWSGDMRALGHHPEGRAWHIAIPGEKQSPFPLTNLAVAGSGDYLQNWIHSGIEKKERYTHIAEPRTGCLKAVGPGSISSVTVVASSCMLADALATSAMLIDEPDELKKWIESVQKTYPKTLFWALHHPIKEGA